MADEFLAQILVLLAGSLLVLSLVPALRAAADPRLPASSACCSDRTRSASCRTTTTVRLLAEIGIVFLVFTLGLEFSLGRMVAMKSEVLGIGGLQMAGLRRRVWRACRWAFGVQPRCGHRDRRRARDVLDRDRGAPARRPARTAADPCATRGRHPVVPGPRVRAVAGARDGAQRSGDVPGTAWLLGMVGRAIVALLVVLVVGRWLLRPLFREISRHRSTETFTLTVLFVALRRRVGDARARPVDGARRLPGRHAAGRNRVQAPDRSRHQAVPGHPARAVLRFGRHAARPAPAARASCRSCC